MTFDISAAFAKARPGDEITPPPGNYDETQLTSHHGGAPTQPITLKLAGCRIAGLKGLGVHDVVVDGGEFMAQGALRNGIQFSQSGENFTACCARIVIQNTTIHDCAEDGIKISQCDQLLIMNNVITRCGQQCIDGLDLNGFLISGNDVSHAGVAAAICVKGGSQAGRIVGNKVHDLTGKTVSGIEVGGYGGDGYTRPAHRGVSATGVSVGGAAKDANVIWAVQGAPIAFTGAVLCSSANNHIDTTSTLQPAAVVVQPDDLGRLSRGVKVAFDRVTPTTARYIQLEKRQQAAGVGLAI